MVLWYFIISHAKRAIAVRSAVYKQTSKGELFYVSFNLKHKRRKRRD
jgi:hypothetical protein